MVLYLKTQIAAFWMKTKTTTFTLVQTQDIMDCEAAPRICI